MAGAAEIYIEGSPGERRAGHLDADGNVYEIYIDRVTRPRLAGAVYLARVTAVDKRQGAAFLDLGHGVSALLSRARDVQQGDAILVQVSRDAHDDKGPAAIRQIVLWGRYMALQPGRGGGLQCARALGQGKRRAQALGVAEAALEDQTDLILRGPASSVSGSVIAAEAARLRGQWKDIEARSTSEKAPVQLMPAPDFVDWMLRDAGPEARIALDDRLDFAAAEALCKERYPDLGDSLAFHNAPEPIFDASGLSDVLEEVFGTEVTLNGGGRLSIEETRALTAIDVDLGSGEAGVGVKDEAIHRLNRRAAEEIARQLILRRISGLVVIDFAGITGRGKMKSLIDILRSRLKNAEGFSDILGMTSAGLIEITRQRVGPSLADLCVTAASRRATPDAEAAQMLRQVLRLKGAGQPVASVSTSAAHVLNGPLRIAKEETEKRLGQPIRLEPGATQMDVRLEQKTP